MRLTSDSPPGRQTGSADAAPSAVPATTSSSASSSAPASAATSASRPATSRPAPAAARPAAGLLADLPTGLSALVGHLSAPADLPEWADWLAELGFLPGERVQVVRRGPIGGDPLVVRIGDSTFALHRAEAACVMVHPQPAADAAPIDRR